jgi:hypothetical protein
LSIETTHLPGKKFGKDALTAPKTQPVRFIVKQLKHYQSLSFYIYHTYQFIDPANAADIDNLPPLTTGYHNNWRRLLVTGHPNYTTQIHFKKQFF